MKLLIFVYTCTKYEKSRALLQQQSWANREDIIFITDNPKSELKNSMYLGNYGNVYFKEQQVIKKILELCLTKEYDWYMIIDDDAYLYIDKLKEFLSFFNEKKSYLIGDFAWKLSDPKWFQHDWFGGGPGYVMSKSTIEKILKVINTVKLGMANEDVWLNNACKHDITIQRIQCPGFYQYPPEEQYEKDDKRLISIHLNHDMTLIERYHQDKK